MYTIYFDNRPLKIVKGIPPDEQQKLDAGQYLVLHQYAERSFADAMQRLRLGRVDGVYVVDGKPDRTFQAVASHFKRVEAGGGLVENASGEVLLIFRRGFWDLPKGKLDRGETLDRCALREVEEETGALGLQLRDKICVTYHTYTEKSEHILKESHWYKMKTTLPQKLSPQTEEDIAECRWVTQGDLGNYLGDMPASIRDVLTTVYGSALETA